MKGSRQVKVGKMALKFIWRSIKETAGTAVLMAGGAGALNSGSGLRGDAGGVGEMV